MDTLDWLNLTPKLTDLDTWSRLWAVRDEPIPYIRCRTCEGYQQLRDLGKPFVHSPTCTLMGGQSRYPWRDLLWIMEHASGAGQIVLPPAADQIIGSLARQLCYPGSVKSFREIPVCGSVHLDSWEMT
jgi:hypothetical protein